MNGAVTEDFKQLVGYSRMPACVLSVEKDKDGNCGTIRFCAVNEPFKRSFYSMFADTSINNIRYDDFDDYIVGKPYTDFLDREPKFEALVFKCAWDGEYIHTYVDTRNVYNYWTEDLLQPVCCEHDDNISYCQFMYNLNKEMDPGKFAAVSPDISTFVIKTCLELRNERDFKTNMNIIAKDIREYTNSFTVAMISLDSENKSFEIISESVLNDLFSVKEIFSEISYETVRGWDNLMENTNEIIIQNDQDIALYESLHPEWTYTLKRDNVKSLCLVPFKNESEIIGYLYIANFDISATTQIKECIELLAFFLSSALANHLFIQKLKGVSGDALANVDSINNPK